MTRRQASKKKLYLNILLPIIIFDKIERTVVLLIMKAQDTKMRLLQIGVDQLSLVGLAGVSVGQLANASGLSKSGFFAHFKSKDQMQVELLDEVARIAFTEIVTPSLNADFGLPRLQALFNQWLGWSNRAGLRGGCPMAAAFFEMDDMPGKVRDHIVMLESRWRRVLHKCLEEAVQAGHLVHETDAAQFIWELQGIYLSHHVSSRFLNQKDARLRAVDAFNALIDRYRLR
ncbi:TetR/AcrR family transcriptional regulator [Ahrensia kielensis]|uniref:TetR/AcrR family transcriptional regulator n=1 Tax=Ahrensia kielensis TaxID=76980 RepID=A0ABU9T2F3_9HYPH